MTELIITELDKYVQTNKHTDIKMHTDLEKYHILLNLILSAQTTDRLSSLALQTLLHEAKTPNDIINLGEDAIMKLIRKSGFYKVKTKRILKLSTSVRDELNGIIPDTYKDLIKLYGIGDKSAKTFLLFTTNKEIFPADTHCIRLANRWGLSKSKNNKKVSEDLMKCFPKKKWRKLHYQFIEFGRKYCKATQHNINTCPICKLIKKQ